MIEIKNLNKYYNKHTKKENHVINNTTLHFDKTGFVCILGESGSGKTTFLNTISGLDSYESGYIRVDDIEMKKYSVSKTDKIRQQNCGYVFQNYYLLSNRTVYENIEIVLDNFKLSKEEKKERIYYVLTNVGLLKYRNKLVKDLSGGEQQRVSIARALVKSPKVIFADEPTGSLDEKNTIQVLNILKKLSKKCLIVMVTHEVRLVEYYADRIIRIDKGTILSDEINNSLDNNTGARTPMDRNIYLKEFENKDTNKLNNVNINIYSNNESKEEVNINVVVINNKIYVEAKGEHVEVLNDSSEIKMVDDYEKEYNDKSFDNFKYELSDINDVDKNKLNIKRICKYAIDNIKTGRKRSIFLYVILFAVAILALVAADDIITLNTIDYENVVTASHGNELVNLKSDSVINKTDIDKIFNIFYDELNTVVKENNATLYVRNNNSTLSFSYNVYDQTKNNNVNAKFSDFDYKTLDYFNEKDLKYGRMPNADNEIIIDEWVLNRLLQNGGLIKNLMGTPIAFLNQYVNTSVSMGNQKMKIVGISNCNSPTIFVDKYQGIRLLTYGIKITSIEYLQEKYPSEFSNINLGYGEVLVNSTKYNGYTTYNNLIDANDKYDVKGYINASYGYDVVISEESYERFIKVLCRYGGYQVLIMSNTNLENINNYLDSKKGYTYDQYNEQRCKIVVDYKYQNEADNYKLAAIAKVKTRLIVTLCIYIFSIIVIFFAMKSNATRHINDIAVFRSLGFSKFSYTLIYIIQLAIITTFTSLVGVLLGLTVFRTIDSISEIEFTFWISNSEVFILVLGLYAFNILIGIIPVLSIMRLTPAKIYAKYDI